MKDETISEAKKPWPFLWSKISLCFAITAWLLILVGIPVTFVLSLLENIPACCSGFCFRIIVLLSPFCAGCAFISGIVSTFGFILQKIKISSKATALGGLVWSAFYFLLIFVLLSPGIRIARYVHKLGIEVICKSNMRVIALGFDRYHANNKSWPYKANWCDLIKPYMGEEDDRIFLCPNDEIGPCSYGMNEIIPDAAEKLPDDLVILFEAAPGWNQVGGPGDVVTDRHRQPGANIAFADGRVEFVDAEDIPNLRWTIDEGEPNEQ